MVADEIASRKRTMSDVSLKKIVLSLEEDHAILPEIAVQEHAKKNASCGTSPELSH